MSNHVSFLLEAEAAKRRLAQVFQSEQLGRANHRSTAIVTRDSSRAPRTDTKQNSKMSQEKRRERTTRAIPTSRPRQMQRDLTVSSFVLALESVGVLLAAYTSAGILASNRIRPAWSPAHHGGVFATASEPAGRIARAVRTGSMTFPTSLEEKKFEPMTKNDSYDQISPCGTGI